MAYVYLFLVIFFIWSSFFLAKELLALPVAITLTVAAYAIFQTEISGQKFKLGHYRNYSNLRLATV